MADEPPRSGPGRAQAVPPSPRHRRRHGAAAVRGTTVAVAASDPRPGGSPQRTADDRGPRETPLTGTTRERVQRAALARVQGAVLRVETDAGGVDEAHVRKADGAARADRTSTRS